MRRLERRGLADATLLADGEAARRLGYRFEPMSAHYQAMLDVARVSLPLPRTRVRDWLDLAPSARTPWIAQADLRAAAALLVLEHAALRREEHRARDELKRRVVGAGTGPDAAPGLLDDARALLHAEGLLSRPAALVPDIGYGLPQPAERRSIEDVAERHVAHWRTQTARLHGMARAQLPRARQDALSGTEANIEQLGHRLRSLREAEPQAERNDANERASAAPSVPPQRHAPRDQ